MKIAIASDHGGKNVKNEAKDYLEIKGYNLKDFSPENDPNDDFPIYAREVASRVSSGEYDMGILACTTGAGMYIVANKFPGIRAVECDDKNEAKLAREHHDANILVLSERKIKRISGSYPNIIKDILDAWFGTEAEYGDDGKYERRREQIKEIEHEILW